METKYNISQSELRNWLYKADHHYLAARLLYLHGLLFAAEENAGFAIELILKCSCKKQGVDFSTTRHKLIDLWSLSKPPFNLDEGLSQYFKKLQAALYTRHPDAENWKLGRKANDQFDALDFLYLKLRKWLVEIISEDPGILTEVDLGKKEESLFSNVIARHGAWGLGTILKRSNGHIDLL